MSADQKSFEHASVNVQALFLRVAHILTALVWFYPAATAHSFLLLKTFSAFKWNTLWAPTPKVFDSRRSLQNKELLKTFEEAVNFQSIMIVYYTVSKSRNLTINWFSKRHYLWRERCRPTKCLAKNWNLYIQGKVFSGFFCSTRTRCSPLALELTALRIIRESVAG